MAPHIGSALSALNRNPEHLLTVCDGRTKTNEQFLKRVAALQRGLERDFKALPGERVLILCQNNELFLESFFAASLCGCVAAPVNFRWSTDEACQSAAVLEPVVLFVDESLMTLGCSLIDAIQSIRGVICFGKPFRSRQMEAEELIRRHFADIPLVFDLAPRQPPDGVALVCFTSGTSGHSKGAKISHAALVGQCLAKINMANYTSGDVYLNAAPLFHIGGLSYAVTLLAVGARQVFLPRFTPTDMRQALRSAEVTATILVPAILAELVRINEGERFSHVRSIVIGAGTPPRAQLEACRRLFPGAAILAAYGMTEAASTVAWRAVSAPGGVLDLPDARGAGAHPEASNCVGAPVPFTEVRVANGSGAPVPAGEEGEVLVRGFHVMDGYWGLPLETRAALPPDGWLRTGDVGCLDASGRLWITGRKKDVVRSGGENVHAAQVEAALASHPGVAAAAVVGLPDESLGERVAAMVQLSGGWRWGDGAGDAGGGGRRLDLAALREHCAAAGLSRYKLPRFAWGSAEALPANAVGKVLKGAVRELLARRAAPGGGGGGAARRSRL